MTKLLKEYRMQTTVSSLVILLPMLMGALLWNRLPDSMMVWGAESFAAKLFIVAGLPLLLLAVHWFCLGFTIADRGNKNQSGKVMGMLFWVLPVLSLCISSVQYAQALGLAMSMDRLVAALLGVVFVAAGNYFPKTRRNSTVGIKLPWTMRNEQNWNKTHRFAGKLWVAGGLVLLAGLLLPQGILHGLFFALILLLVLAPLVYSRQEYQQQVQAGTWVSDGPEQAAGHRAMGVIPVLILAAAALLLFTGNVKVLPGEEGFAVRCSYYTDLSIPYEQIDSIEYRETLDKGTRTNGLGTLRLAVGTFQNEEFGSYTLYSYRAAEEGIVLRDGDHVLVLAEKTPEETRALYEELKTRIEQ